MFTWRRSIPTEGSALINTMQRLLLWTRILWGWLEKVTLWYICGRNANRAQLRLGQIQEHNRICQSSEIWADRGYVECSAIEKMGDERTPSFDHWMASQASWRSVVAAPLAQPPPERGQQSRPALLPSQISLHNSRKTKFGSRFFKRASTITNLQRLTHAGTLISMLI